MPLENVRQLTEKAAQAVENKGFEEANKLLDKACEILYKKKSDRDFFQEEGNEVAITYNALADAFFYASGFEQALVCWYKILDIRLDGWGELHVHTLEAYILIGYYLNYLCRYEDSRESSWKGIEIAGFLPNAFMGELECYSNIGFSYAEENDYENALFYYKRASGLLTQEMKNLTEQELINIGAVYNNTGRVYLSRGAYQEALDEFEKMKTVLDEDNHHYNHYRNNLGLCYIGLKRYDEALELFIHVANTWDFLIGKVLAHVKILEIYMVQNQVAKAENSLKKLLQLVKEIEGWHQLIPNIYCAVGKFYKDTNQLSQALSYSQLTIQQSLFNFNRADNPFMVGKIPKIRTKRWLFEGLKLKAETQTALYHQTEELKYLKAAIDTFINLDYTIDLIRRHHKATESQLTLAEQAKDIYEKGIAASFDLYQKTNKKKYVETAFRFAEKSKAILLLHEVKHLGAMLSADIPEAVLAEEKQLIRRLNKLEKNAAEKDTKEQFDLRRKLEQLIENLEQEHPDYHQLKYSTESASPATLQQELTDKQTIISYFIGEEKGFYFNISKAGLKMGRLEKPKIIEEKVAVFNALVTDVMADSAAYSHAAHWLYEQLIEPALGNSPAEHLIILPDGALSQLPFEALINRADKQANDFHELSYLIREYEVTYHFSATLWQYGRMKIIPQKYERSFAGFAPTYSGELSPDQDRSGHYRVCENEAGLCYELPYAKEEITEIARLFGTKKTALYLNEAASKAAFLNQQTASTKYVHIAAHGFYNSDAETDCYIQFSADEQADIKLTLKDIQVLRLDTFLLVLSCCNTGVGRYRKGESMLALHRGFLAAGAKNVIATIFKVPDKLAALLMVNMYENHLKKGNNIGSALRQAKLSMIADKDVVPIAWCGYQLIGS